MTWGSVTPWSRWWSLRGLLVTPLRRNRLEKPRRPACHFLPWGLLPLGPFSFLSPLRCPALSRGASDFSSGQEAGEWKVVEEASMEVVSEVDRLLSSLHEAVGAADRIRGAVKECVLPHGTVWILPSFLMGPSFR